MLILMLAGDIGQRNTNADTVLTLAVKNTSEDDRLVILINYEEIPSAKIMQSNMEFLPVPNATLGALATLAFGLSRIPENSPFIVVPSNSTIPASEISAFSNLMIKTKSMVGAVVFEGTSPLYSYARLDSDGLIMEVVEKQVVGSCAMAGIFFFGDKVTLSECIKWAMVNNAHTEGKFFIAPALNYFIAKSQSISLFHINPDMYTRL
jgi:hypothetical protein